MGWLRVLGKVARADALFPVFLLLLAQLCCLGSAAVVNTSLPDVLCDAKEICVKQPGARCTVRSGFVSLGALQQDIKCAAVRVAALF